MRMDSIPDTCALPFLCFRPVLAENSVSSRAYLFTFHMLKSVQTRLNCIVGHLGTIHFLGQNLAVHFVTTLHPQFFTQFVHLKRGRGKRSHTAGVVAMKLQWPRCIEGALTLDGTLDAKERRKRGLFFAINCTTLVFNVLFLLIALQYGGLRRWSTIAGVVVSLLTVVYILCKKKLTTPFVVGVSYMFASCVFSGDLIARCNGDMFWAPMVLIVDMLLVLQVPTRYTAGLVCVVLAWMAVMAAEESFRFGLLDLPGLVPQDGEFGRRTYLGDKANCDKLPCAKPAVTLTLGAVLVFVIDFLATRGFARDILKEQDTMQRTISTVQEIASLLAGYDVEGVAEMLKVHEAALPEGMRDALQSIEENLRKYKAYLPQTCLPFDKEDVKEVNEDARVCDSDKSTVSQNSSRLALFSTLVQPLDLSSTRATLLTLNIKDTLHRLEEDSARFSDLFTTLLLKTLQATEVRRGMVDVFVGDRIHCSFNTSKACASHATSALHAATLLLRGDDNTIAPHVNMGVATGKVLRGDMGCEVMRRFSMVGTLARDVNVLERAGRVLGCSVLCNRLCFSDAECEHQLRLIPCKIELAAGCDAEVVAELVVPKGARAASVVDEWMYVVGGKKDWEDYNLAVRSFMRGECSAEDVAAAERKGPAYTPVNVVASSGGCDVLYLPFSTRGQRKKDAVFVDNSSLQSM